MVVSGRCRAFVQCWSGPADAPIQVGECRHLYCREPSGKGRLMLFAGIRSILLIASLLVVVTSACKHNSYSRAIDQGDDIATGERGDPTTDDSDGTADTSGADPAGDSLGVVNDFSILIHNVFLDDDLTGIEASTEGSWGQTDRAALIAQASYVKGYDLVVLNELFAAAPAQTVLDGLAMEYPYQTPVLGRSLDGWDVTLGDFQTTARENGGVAIVSRWPIERRVQYVFPIRCGAESVVNKGFIYVRLSVRGRAVHVVGTHLQAETPSICLSTTPAEVRAHQATDIHEFLLAQDIPPEEPLFIGGDMNVMREDVVEYGALLDTLAVSAPTKLLGTTGTWDPTSNELARRQYPDLPSEHIDYVFVSRDGPQPDQWFNLTLDPVSLPWVLERTNYREFSDHFPVAAFAYATSSTPTGSERPLPGSYQATSFHNRGALAFVALGSAANDDWLRTTALAPSGDAVFSVYRFPYRMVPRCLWSGDYVSIEGMSRPGWFWNWYGGVNGTYGYYTRENNESNRLRIYLEIERDDCIKNGDTVVFVDTDVLAGFVDRYVTVWPDSEWAGVPFLWSMTIGDYERFDVTVPATLAYGDWAADLVYRP
jgi:sphingomyelin phosphodiesterase